ncbi:sugar transferase [Parapedobacter sp. ISTM3]|uniref:Sugar transferase involved in LPS biosynthesis (Colanic, teichoic acid) n=1 Tax=Parapedobacter luteus TaxID=623280 RepID=A0A1T5C719_9SPHI|nr:MULTISPECIES: sugar transferase [Parapedobacter]MBK1439200.1 sugar transferase [Parapedobacter sp. ISTM3]SKB55149.1 Sugar transferase involved in LPS biosynthesis (colanic, teichoic acid) [Parapedobacter luteus]
MDLLTKIKQENKFLTISVAYLGTKFVDELDEALHDDIDVIRFSKLADVKRHVENQSILSIPDILILEVEDELSSIHSFIKGIKANPLSRSVSIILLGFKNNRALLTEMFAPYVSDIYCYPFNVSNIEERLKFLVKFKLIGDKHASVRTREGQAQPYQIPLSKRAFDILFSGTLLLLLAPLMAVIALLIKLDSKGPIIYKSKRAGTGYKVFSFYKFRSMKVNADKELEKLAALNQYAANGGTSAFVKIKDDPRVTRLGSFLRNTSLDELPQLFNVFRGDMSLVGNRPLPLYEAQELTSDEWAMRFLGPAGITGLWQVTKRGKSEMSDEERRRLDNDYATHFSFWMDLKILLKTVPALLQKEKV